MKHSPPKNFSECWDWQTIAAGKGGVKQKLLLKKNGGPILTSERPVSIADLTICLAARPVKYDSVEMFYTSSIAGTKRKWAWRRYLQGREARIASLLLVAKGDR